MPAGIIRRQIKHRPSKRKNIMANRPQPTAPISITAAVAAGSTLTVTFNQPVALKGVPQYTVDVAGADPVSAVLTAPNICEITFDSAIAAGDPEIVGAVFARYRAASKKVAIMAGVRAAKFFRQQRRYDDALALFQAALSYKPSSELEAAISKTKKLAGQRSPT